MPRLLIVDDEKSLCQMLEIAFRKGGFSVETVSSGALAQRKMNSQHYDVVVSDIRMPDLTGIELLEYAKKIGQPAAFILITAVPTMSTAIEALNRGGIDAVRVDRGGPRSRGAAKLAAPSFASRFARPS